jgi:hypothetical protein
MFRSDISPALTVTVRYASYQAYAPHIRSPIPYPRNEQDGYYIL